jgi:hypothetical protein
MIDKQIAIFEEHEIRRLYDEKTETWLFSDGLAKSLVSLIRSD